MLFKLLTLPLSGPFEALSWVADQVTEAAEDAIHDPTALRKELELAEARLDAGEMTEAEYEEIEKLLIQRLREAHARMAAKEAKA
jgi:DNA-binding FadR family transcriptional regulator